MQKLVVREFLAANTAAQQPLGSGCMCHCQASVSPGSPRVQTGPPPPSRIRLAAALTNARASLKHHSSWPRHLLPG